MAKKSKGQIVAVVGGNRKQVVRTDGKYLYLIDGSKQRILNTTTEVVRRPPFEPEKMNDAIQTEPQE